MHPVVDKYSRQGILLVPVWAFQEVGCNMVFRYGGSNIHIVEWLPISGFQYGVTKGGFQYEYLSMRFEKWVLLWCSKTGDFNLGFAMTIEYRGSNIGFQYGGSSIWVQIWGPVCGLQ